MKYYILNIAQRDFFIQAFFGMPYSQWNSNFPAGMVANSQFLFTELKNNNFGLTETVMTSENVVNYYNTFDNTKQQAIDNLINSVTLREVPANEYKFNPQNP